LQPLPHERFDPLVLGGALPPRQIEPRIRRVLERMRGDPSQSVSAADSAASVGLSCSRFLHLFKDEVGASFRNVRTWKRARSLLHHVNKPANFAHLALDRGYPDSTHFSHSIRQVYGFTPRDLFAGSRRLTLVGADAANR
jgi:AraC-like DNA-binding protein